MSHIHTPKGLVSAPSNPIFSDFLSWQLLFSLLDTNMSGSCSARVPLLARKDDSRVGTDQFPFTLLRCMLLFTVQKITIILQNCPPLKRAREKVVHIKRKEKYFSQIVLGTWLYRKLIQNSPNTHLRDTFSVQKMYNKCTISVRSVYNQCTISVR